MVTQPNLSPTTRLKGEGLDQDNLRTPLHAAHLAAGAKMVPFGGWDMPVQYSSILAEVRVVRTASGIFDVSHMGRLYISGPDAGAFLDWVVTGGASTLAMGRARYSLVCNESGGVIDDTVYYRLAEDEYLLVCNAGNRTAVVSWFHRWIKERFPHTCSMDDRTASTALLAFQGPQTPKVIDRLCQLDDGQSPSSLRYFSWGQGTFLGKPAFVSRTGYTGEDGFEIGVDAGDAVLVWSSLVDQGAVPCGLGARDVLRLEAGLPLHGHELNATITPLEGGLERFVRFDKEYIGSEALLNQRDHGVVRKLVGLKLPGRSAPRAGYRILDQGKEVGKVTSGSFSPTLDMSIAMGYVLVRHAVSGHELLVEIRERLASSEVVSLPFYKRRRSKSN